MPFFSRRSSTGFHGLPGPEALGGSPGLMWPRPPWSTWPWLKNSYSSLAPSERVRAIDSILPSLLLMVEICVTLRAEGVDKFAKGL